MFEELRALPYARLTPIVHTAIALITHRAGFSGQYQPSGRRSPAKAWESQVRKMGLPSAEDAALVLDIVRTIEAAEKVPLPSLSVERAENYVHVLSDLVSARAREELKYDTAKADRILHGLRERTAS